MLGWRPTSNGMNHFNGVCLTPATFTSFFIGSLTEKRTSECITMKPAISLFLNVHEFPIFCVGNVPNLSKPICFVFFFYLGEAEENYYLWRQNIELNCNCNWKSQDVYGHPVSLT